MHMFINEQKRKAHRNIIKTQCSLLIMSLKSKSKEKRTQYFGCVCIKQ